MISAYIYKTQHQKVFIIFIRRGFGLNNIERVDLFVDAKNRIGDTSYVNYLPPKSVTPVSVMGSWEGYVKNTPGERINFFFFPVDTLSKYTWEEIVNGRRYSNMLSYRISDLERMSWRVIYPSENYKFPSRSLK